MPVFNEKDTDVLAAIAGELLLRERSVRQSPEAMELLFHRDFFEFNLGRRCDRREAMDAHTSQEAPLEPEPMANISGLEGVRLSRDAVLLTYTSQDADGKRTRCSIWRMTPGGWRLFFRQATLIPG
ncbi:MAG TPA: DUF4440 domain-containing protein [Trebonia sp.]|nr:DUF4440 domain-containing protein [Trebonia sp.]